MKFSIGKIFLIAALSMLFFALLFGVCAGLMYSFPDLLKGYFTFVRLRPMHVSSALFWILLGVTGSVYVALDQMNIAPQNKWVQQLHFACWMIAIIGVFYSYLTGDFGGREYWEFNPIWALPIALSWMLFLLQFIRCSKHIKPWPVYVWMWMTGILFFVLTFTENYLWIFPYFRQDFIHDMTIQWKSSGSMVGSWNQLIYGTSFYLMERISKDKKVGYSKLAFAIFFLGLINLMYNWGHHVYAMPTAQYIRVVGYVVSMTEWIFFLKIIYNWKKTMYEIENHNAILTYRFLLAADFWVFLNLGQAILMSIPAFNLFTHGTHVTVAHAMGTTIGINTMILLAACVEFLEIKKMGSKWFNAFFWLTQISLFVFWISLIIAGVKKGIWQLYPGLKTFGGMMDSLGIWFQSFFYAGLGLMLGLTGIIFFIFYQLWVQPKSTVSHD